MEKIKEEKKSLIIAKIRKSYSKYFTLVTVSLFLVIFIGIKEAQAASLNFSPSQGSYTIGQTFLINIYVNSNEQAMNAASGVIKFPQDKLEVVSLSKDNTIFNFWVKEPSFSNNTGEINFEGIVLNPGFIGSSGKIITITFKTKAAGNFSLTFSSGSVLANDGKGTNILTGLGSGSYNIVLEKITSEAEEKPVVGEPTSTPFAEKPEIISLTHPDQTAWYNNTDVEFKWELPYGVTGVSFAFDNKPTSDPGPVSDGLFSTKSYEDVKDGIWYLHLKFRDKSGWSGIDHFKVQIDTIPPEPFEVEITQKEALAWPVLNFKTADTTSGIDRYEVEIDSPSPIFKIVKAEDAFFEVPVLEPGEHTTIVKAIDKAGNQTIAVTDFIIKPIEAPVIKSYPRELRSTNPLFLSGTALVEATINIFIQSEKTDKIIKQISQSDKDGNWYSIYQDGLTNGRYFIWAEAINSQGRKSAPSYKVSLLVTPPIFVTIGSWVINYFTVFIILLVFTILIIAFLAFWAGLMRNRLKKETDEAQVALHKNLREFRKLIEQELILLDKLKGKEGYDREKANVKKALKGRVDFMEKKIAKEIKDIEDLLK